MGGSVGGAGLCCWYTVTDVALGGKDEADDEAVAAFTTPLVMISLILLTAPERDEGRQLGMKTKAHRVTTEQKQISCTDCQQAAGSVLGRADTEVCP